MRAKPCQWLSASAFFLILAGCVHHASPPTRPGDPISGPTDFKRPKQDGKPSWQVDVAKIPDAVPVPHRGAYKNAPYDVFGQTYYPLSVSAAKNYREVGLASWYGTQFHSNPTSNGEIYDLYGMTAAHKTLPLPSYVRVTNLANGKSVILRVNDRGPFHSDRIIDLSYGAALKLGYAESGVARVQVEAIDPVQWQARHSGRLALPTAKANKPTIASNEPPAPVGAKKKSASRSLWPVSPGSRLRQSRECAAGKEPTGSESACTLLYQSAYRGGQNPTPRTHRPNNPSG